MATSGNERRSFGVFWDIENCRVPKGGSARELVSRIREKLYASDADREAEFMCVCDASKENKELMKELNSAQVTIVHVDATNKNAADEKLRQRMRYFVETHKPPATIVLISGDVNFEGLLSDIQHRHQLDAILIHPERINEGLRQCVQRRIPYAEFTKKLPSRQTQPKSVEHECIIHGLPVGRDTKSLWARLHQVSENCGGKVVEVSPPRAIIRFKDLDVARRARGRMNGEDVFGNKIQVKDPYPIEATLASTESHNNGYPSPKSRSARKKLRKKRGSKSAFECHSSDGSGNSSQSSPQGSPKSSPFRQRSPGLSHLTQLPPGDPTLRGLSPQRILSTPPGVCAEVSFSPNKKISSQGGVRSESTGVAVSVGGSQSMPAVSCNGKFSPAPRFAPQHSGSSQLDDGDSEMESLPWNQAGKVESSSLATVVSTPPLLTTTTTTSSKSATATAVPGGFIAVERERHNSFTSNFVCKKPQLVRARTLSDPPHGLRRQATPERPPPDNPGSRSFCRQSTYSALHCVPLPQQVYGSPYREHRGRNGSPAFRGALLRDRRFSRSRSNSSTRSSPSLSDSGDRYSISTAPSEPSLASGSSPTYVGQGSSASAFSTPPDAASRLASQQGDFHLRITNLDCKKLVKELKEELRRHIQRHTQVEDICIEYQADGSRVAVVRVPTLEAAERVATRLHRSTKIGCKRIHVTLKHHPPVTDEVRSNVLELLKAKPKGCLKWFAFIDQYQKRYHSNVTLSDVQQMTGQVEIEHDCSSDSHTIRLSQTTAVPQPLSSHLGTLVPGHFVPSTPPQVGSHQSASPCDKLDWTSEPREALNSVETQTCDTHQLCNLHCPPGSAELCAARETRSLPCVRLHLKTFSTEVHALLHEHVGCMPLKSFLACYQAKFPPLEMVAGDTEKVSLEHLISCVPGVKITRSESLDKQVLWAANQNEAAGDPPLSPVLEQLAQEAVEVLASVPGCTLPLAEFLPRYQVLFGRPLCLTDYGHNNLQQLMESLVNVVQIFGWNSCRQVSLTHRIHVRRFVSDLRSVLRHLPQWQVSIQELPNAFCDFFRRAFSVSDYGVCFIEDLLTDLPGNVFLVTHKENMVKIELTRREVLLDLEERVLAVFRHQTREQGLPLAGFLAAFASCHGVGLPLAHYQVFSVRELLQLLPQTVTIERKSGRDLVRPVPGADHYLRAERARQILSGAGPEARMPRASFLQHYTKLYNERLTPEELPSALHGVVEVIDDENLPGVSYVQLVSEDALAARLRRLLCRNSGHPMTISEIEQAYREVFGYSQASSAAACALTLGHPTLNAFADAHSNFIVLNGDGENKFIGLASVGPSVADVCSNAGFHSPTPTMDLQDVTSCISTTVRSVGSEDMNDCLRTGADVGGTVMTLADLQANLCEAMGKEDISKGPGGNGLDFRSWDGSSLANRKVGEAETSSEQVVVIGSGSSSDSTQPSKGCSSSTMTSSVKLSQPVLPTLWKPLVGDPPKSCPSSSDRCSSSIGDGGGRFSTPEHGTVSSPAVVSGYSARATSSRPGSRTASNSSGSPLGSPLHHPGTPRRNRLAARFTNPVVPPSPSTQSDTDT